MIVCLTTLGSKEALIRYVRFRGPVVGLRGKYFTPPYPADTIVEITSLYSSEALIEIEASPSSTKQWSVKAGGKVTKGSAYAR